MRTSMSFEKENCSLCFHRSSSNVYVLWSQPTFHSSLTTKLPFHKQDLQGIWSFWPFASNDHQPSLEWKGYRFSLWFNTLILTTGKSYFKKKKNVLAACLITKKSEKPELLQKSNPCLTDLPLWQITFYLLISEASQTHSLTMNSLVFPLRETSSWASVGSGEGAHHVHLRLLKTTEQKRTLCFSWPPCSLLMCSASLLGNSSSPDFPRNGGPHSCLMARSLNAWSFRPAGVTDGTRPWSQVLLRNAAIVWHLGAMTGRALWVIWFSAGWLGSSRIYSYNCLRSY